MNSRWVGASVAFAKRMHGIDLAEVKGRTLHERRRGQASQQILPLQPAKQVIERTCKMHRRTEVCVAFGDVNDAELTGPREDILKEVPVNGRQVLYVERAGNTHFMQLTRSLDDEYRLNLLQLGVVSLAKAILRACIPLLRVRVTIKAGGHRG